MRPRFGLAGLVPLTVLIFALAGCGGDTSESVQPIQDAGSVTAGDTDATAQPDAAPDTSDAPSAITFATHILPLFERTGCTGCHGDEVAKGDHRLHTLEALTTTGPHAPVIVPCRPDESVLIQKLEDAPPFGERMPQGGPYYGADEMAMLRKWIADGAEQVDVCEDEPAPLPLVEERVFRVSERTELLSTDVELPVPGGESAVFPVEGRLEVGFVGAAGGYWRVTREREVTQVLPGWDGDTNLGGIRAVAAIEGLTLIASEIGLLYFAEGRLWPSPVDEVLQASVSALVPDTETEPGDASIWLATGRGLFQLTGDQLFEVRPSQESAGTAVGAISMGPDPQDADRRAIWASFGERVYAVRPDDDGVMAYTFEVRFEHPVIDIESDGAGHVWAVTERGLFLRRPADVRGVAPWIHWILPDGQRAADVAVHRDGATWVLTDKALYRALDTQWRWQLALGTPASDVAGVAVGDGGSAWLTRPRVLTQLSPAPTVGVVGMVRGDSLNAFPEVSAWPAFPDRVRQVSITVDDCAPVTFEQAPYVVAGGALVWSECLGAGAHELKVQVDYDGLESATAAVPFGWVEREEQITWEGHVRPEIYARSCARPGCHIDGFAPDSYDTWVEKIDEIVQRTDPATVQGRMPPNGPRLTEAERLLIQWWRDDGFRVE